MAKKLDIFLVGCLFTLLSLNGYMIYGFGYTNQRVVHTVEMVAGNISMISEMNKKIDELLENACE